MRQPRPALVGGEVEDVAAEAMHSEEQNEQGLEGLWGGARHPDTHVRQSRKSRGKGCKHAL